MSSATLPHTRLSPSRGRERELSVEPKPAHLPALDGVRGLAVLLVLFCHATVVRPNGAVGQLFLSLARISWSGVDLFFVLSGFLITGILFDAKGQQHYFRNFYARRTVRIFPLYYAFLLFALLLVPAIPFLAKNFSPQPAETSSYWLYLSNYAQAIHPTSHIAHVSWSLAIEEQFYLCWPIVVYACGRSTLRRACGVMFFGSLALRAALLLTGAGGENAWSIANGFTPLRLDALAAGAWIALTLRGDRNDVSTTLNSLVKQARRIAPLSAAGIVAIVVGSYLAGWRGGMAQGKAYVLFGYTMFALLYGCVLLFALSARRRTTLNAIFESRFLRAFGKYSYAIYLLHEPVNVLVRSYAFDPQKDGRSTPALLLGQAAFYATSFTLSFGVALLSWHAMEKHFLKLKSRFESDRRHTNATFTDAVAPDRRLRPAA